MGSNNKAPIRSAASSSTHKTSRKTVSSSRPTSVARIEKRVRDVLLEVMCASESDQVRVSAAKALMEKMRKNENDGANDETKQNAGGREEALSELYELLVALADAKSARRPRSRKVD